MLSNSKTVLLALSSLWGPSPGRDLHPSILALPDFSPSAPHGFSLSLTRDLTDIRGMNCHAPSTVLSGRSVSPESASPSLSLFLSSTFIFRTCRHISNYLLRLLSTYLKLARCDFPPPPMFATEKHILSPVSSGSGRHIPVYPARPFPAHTQYRIQFLTDMLHLRLTLSFAFLVPFSFSLRWNYS